QGARPDRGVVRRLRRPVPDLRAVRRGRNGAGGPLHRPRRARRRPRGAADQRRQPRPGRGLLLRGRPGGRPLRRADAGPLPATGRPPHGGVVRQRAGEGHGPRQEAGGAGLARGVRGGAVDPAALAAAAEAARGLIRRNDATGDLSPPLAALHHRGDNDTSPAGVPAPCSSSAGKPHTPPAIHPPAPSHTRAPSLLWGSRGAPCTTRTTPSPPPRAPA